MKPDGTRAETRFRLSPKRTSPFKSAGASVQSTAGSRGVRISGSNAGYTMFRGGVKVLATHSVRQFPLHFPSRASPCAIRFQTSSTIKLPRGESSSVPKGGWGANAKFEPRGIGNEVDNAGKLSGLYGRWCSNYGFLGYYCRLGS